MLEDEVTRLNDLSRVTERNREEMMYGHQEQLLRAQREKQEALKKKNAEKDDALEQEEKSRKALLQEHQAMIQNIKLELGAAHQTMLKTVETKHAAELEKLSAEKEALLSRVEAEKMKFVVNSKSGMAESRLIEGKMNDLESQLHDAESKLIIAQEQVEDYQLALENVTSQADRAETAIQELREDLSRESSQYKTLQSECDLLRRENERWRDELVSVQVETLREGSKLLQQKTQGPSSSFTNDRHLAFSSAVWELAKKVDKIRKMSHHVSVVRIKSLPAQEGADTALLDEAMDLYYASKQAKEDCRSIIGKFVTDEEKLSLGIPLLLFEAGQGTAEWTSASPSASPEVPSSRPNEDRPRKSPQAKLIAMRNQIAEGVQSKLRSPPRATYH